MPATGDRITKRKDGLFQGMYTAQTPDGPKRKYIYGRKKKDVERKLAEARGDAARGIVAGGSSLRERGRPRPWAAARPLAQRQPPQPRDQLIVRRCRVVRVDMRKAGTVGELVDRHSLRLRGPAPLLHIGSPFLQTTQAVSKARDASDLF
jgi:hypothetical protein